MHIIYDHILEYAVVFYKTYSNQGGTYYLLLVFLMPPNANTAPSSCLHPMASFKEGLCQQRVIPSRMLS